MKKRHSLAFYALVVPAITLGAGAVQAEQSADKDTYRQQQSTQRDQSATQRDQKMRGQSGVQSQNYIGSVPTGGMQASDLIGAEVKTPRDENVGSVSDLIIDQNGQVVGIVIGVGGFLGLGEKDVAIGWDHVIRSGGPDEQELRIDVTREQLNAAQKFEKQD